MGISLGDNWDISLGYHGNIIGTFGIYHWDIMGISFGYNWDISLGDCWDILLEYHGNIIEYWIIGI
jgi:hypothetical protein